MPLRNSIAVRRRSRRTGFPADLRVGPGPAEPHRACRGGPGQCAPPRLSRAPRLRVPRAGSLLWRLAEAVQGSCQLVVTDVVMPGISGKALAEQLRARWPEIKVLFMSGYPNEVILRHGLMNGEVNYLQKPFTASELAAKVREVMA